MLDFISMILQDDLRKAIDAVCPNDGTYIGNPSDQSTWGFHAKPEATPEQIAAGTDAIVAFDCSLYQPGGDIYEAEKVKLDRYAEYPDTRDQLDAIWKALDAIGSTIALPQEAIDMLSACQAVKTKYPILVKKGL